MSERINLEHEQARGINLPAEWSDLISTLKFDSSIERLPSPVANCELKIGKGAVYISRVDINDVERSTYTPIAEQVARLLISNGMIVDVKIDNKDLAPDTFRTLSGSDTFFKEIVSRFHLSVDVSDQDAMTIESIRARSEKDVKTKFELKQWFLERPHTPRRSVRLDDIDTRAIDVAQQTISILTEDHPERYIASMGAGPCFIVGSYNPETHASGLTHIDGLTNMTHVIERLRSGTQSKTVRVFGGDESSLNQLIQLKGILEEMGLDVEEWDVLNDIKSIAIDKTTGEYLDVIGKSSV